LFYVALRAQLRYHGGHQRKSITFDEAFAKSLKDLIDQTKLFIDLRATMEQSAIDQHYNYVTHQGRYSTGVFPAMLNMQYKDFEDSLRSEVAQKDARELPADSLDVIICDPPYGFNTTEDQTGLADLYSEFLHSAVMALRDKGHLVICLPAESYTGRNLPYCTRSNIVANQVLVKARELRKEIYRPARSVPNSVCLPPYYWKSEKALRRTILHFRIKDM
jgi:23S rRNA G2445 N2-methylase RlmL